MTAELPCCQGLPQHTYGDGCLLHREDAYDVGTEEGRRAAAKEIAKDVYDKGGFLEPGVQLFRLEPGDRVLSQEDIRRLLGGEGT